MSGYGDSVRQLFKGGSILLVGLVFQLGISFFAKLIVARELSLSEFGGVALGMTMASVAATLCLVGMQEGVGRFLPRYDEKVDRRGVLISAFTLALPAGITVGTLLLIVAPWVASELFNSPEVTPVLRVFAIVVPLIVTHRLVMSTVQGNQQSLPKVLIENILRPLTRFIAIGVVIVIGISSVRIAWAYFAGWALPVVVGIVYIIRYTPLFNFRTHAETRRREMLKFSIPLLFSAALSLVFNDLDTLLLGYFSESPAPVGIYNAVYPLGNLLTTALIAFGFIFMPVISELHGDGDLDQVRRLSQVVTKWVFMTTLPVFLVLVAFPRRTISLTFGAKYASGETALAVLSVGFFIHAVFGLNRETVISLGETRVKMYADFGAAVANLLLNFLLIPQYGPLGAAVATSLTFIGMNIALSAYLYRRATIVPFNAAILRPASVGIGSFIVVYTIIRTMFSPTIPVMIGGFTVFVIIYWIAILQLGGIEEEEILIVESIEERFGVDFEPIKLVVRWFM